MSSFGDTVVAFPGRKPLQIGFSREELTRILDLYGRMVAAGLTSTINQSAWD